MFDVPAETPVTIPVVVPIVTAPVDVLQVPPVVASLNVTDLPTQTSPGPDIADGTGSTFIILEVVHPVPAV